MAASLKGRVALVTGSSRGIGKVIAETLSRAGADLIICGRDKDALESAAREIVKSSYSDSRICTFCLDATKKEEVKRLFEIMVESLGCLDILVNNIGGVRQFAKFPDLTDEDWYEVFETNVMTTVRFTREAIPWLERSEHAAVVNIASVAGKQPGEWNPHYGSVKASVIYLSKALANFLGPKGIRVNSLCSSTIRGEGVWLRDVTSKAQMEGLSFEAAETAMEKAVRAKAPLGTIGTPEDVANYVRFLVSDEAKFVTGTCVQVDGGTIRSIF